MESALSLTILLGKRRAMDESLDYSKLQVGMICKPKKPLLMASPLNQPPEPLTVKEEDISDNENDDSTTNTNHMIGKYVPQVYHPQIEQLKELIMNLSQHDRISVTQLKQLNAHQIKAFKNILARRYDEKLQGEIEKMLKAEEPTPEFISTYEYLNIKRVDHCEKSIMSLKLTLLKDSYLSKDYGKYKPLGAKDKISRAVFDQYFCSKFNPDEEVLISQPDRHGANPENDKKLVRRYAIFCMKKGLTKSWFKSVSTKLIDRIDSIQVEDVIKYYFDHIDIKLDEIFQPKGKPDSEPDEGYYKTLDEKVSNNKFKLPFTKKELEKCEVRAKKKIKKNRPFIEKSEREDFQRVFGSKRWEREYETWLQEDPRLRGYKID